MSLRQLDERAHGGRGGQPEISVSQPSSFHGLEEELLSVGRDPAEAHDAGGPEDDRWTAADRNAHHRPRRSQEHGRAVGRRDHRVDRRCRLSVWARRPPPGPGRHCHWCRSGRRGRSRPGRCASRSSPRVKRSVTAPVVGIDRRDRHVGRSGRTMRRHEHAAGEGERCGCAAAAERDRGEACTAPLRQSRRAPGCWWSRRCWCSPVARIRVPSSLTAAAYVAPSTNGTAPFADGPDGDDRRSRTTTSRL